MFWVHRIHQLANKDVLPLWSIYSNRGVKTSKDNNKEVCQKVIASKGKKEKKGGLPSVGYVLN